MAGAVLTRTVGGQRQIIAEGSAYPTAAASYTLVTIPLQYASALTPDSLHIIISSGSGLSLTDGTTLQVDDIDLAGTALAAQETEAARGLTLFPNPSTTGVFTLEASSGPALLDAPLIVCDLTGRVVLTETAPGTSASRRTVDLRGQAPGVYILRLTTASKPITRRLVIR